MPCCGKGNDLGVGPGHTGPCPRSCVFHRLQDQEAQARQASLLSHRRALLDSAEGSERVAVVQCTRDELCRIVEAEEEDCRGLLERVAQEACVTEATEATQELAQHTGAVPFQR